jgi:hypothetical protein
MKRVVVRVYLGDAKAKGNPLAQAVGFLGTSLATPGSTAVDWTAGIVTAPVAGTPNPQTSTGGAVVPGAPAPPGTTITPSPAPTPPTSTNP